MEYRMADASDIDMLMNVRLSMLRIVNDLPVDYIFDDKLVTNSRRYFLEGDQTTVVAVDDGRCVACASMSYIEIMPTFSHTSGKRAHLMNVYTVIIIETIQMSAVSTGCRHFYLPRWI